jgi:hypothetical protein
MIDLQAVLEIQLEKQHQTEQIDLFPYPQVAG